MPYYLQDTNSVYYQLGVTPQGQWTLTVTSAQTITDIAVRDANDNYWLLSVSTSGQLVLTLTDESGVPSPPVVSIVLMDSNGIFWKLTATPFGQPLMTLVFIPSTGYQIQVNDNL